MTLEIAFRAAARRELSDGAAWYENLAKPSLIDQRLRDPSRTKGCTARSRLPIDV